MSNLLFPCTYCTYLYIYTTYTTLYIHYERSTINTKDTSKDPELFGIEHGNDAAADAEAFADDELEEDEQQQHQEQQHEQQQQQSATAQKRHIGAVYRSGFLPSYRYLRSPTGSTGGRFSRSGRARQFV